MPKPKISAKDIDELLPQTQCGECGYGGCMPYAEAIAAGRADIDRCPPGGIATLQNLGALLSVDIAPFAKQEKFIEQPRQVAHIREDDCIGCTKCISACPVDAIIGTNKHMHTVIDFECTGCQLCIEPCPVDCIDMVPSTKSYSKPLARSRHSAKRVRELQNRQAKDAQYLQKRNLAADSDDQKADILAKQDYILQALQRAQQKKQSK